MAADHHTTRAPNYLSAFKCVGGACEETCCANFHVDVDRATFRVYMAVTEPGIGQDLRNHVKKRPDPRTPGRYARIQLSPAGACPFLDQDRLCSIQNRLGEGALSQTCRSYPRETWEREGRSYLGAKLSCPEAARLCVSSPDAMAFAEGCAEPAGEGHGQTVRGAVHAATLEVTRDRAMPVWKAIIFAGVITETFLPHDGADEPAGSALLQSIADYTAQTREAIAQQDFTDPDKALAFKLLIKIALSASGKGNAHNRLPRIAQTSLGEIMGNTEDFDGAALRYAELYGSRFKPFDEAHDYALRNFVLNYLYINRTFLAGPVLPQFQNLAVRFGVVRLLLVGLASARPEGLSLADYAAVVSSASRIMDHDESMSTEICAALEAIEPRSVPLAARMVIPPV